MNKQIVRQKGGILYYDDGTTETIAEYRKRNNLDKIDHSKKYAPEELAERNRIISEIMKFDKSAGMKYDPEKGFIRDENNKLVITEEHARETFSGNTTNELKRIEQEMIKTREALKNAEKN